MQNLRISSLQWAVGVLGTLIGALVWVAPHQFSFLQPTAWQTFLPAWGGAFLLAGLGLLSLTMLLGSRRLVPMLHLLAGVLLLSLAAGFWLSQAWTGVIAFGGLGLSTVIASALPRSPQPAGGQRADLLSLTLGLTSLALGLLFLLAPLPVDSLLLRLQGWPVRVFGGAFLLGGAGLAGMQLVKRLRQKRSHPAAWGLYGWIALTHLAYGLLGVRYQYTWLAGIYTLLFAVFLMILPWMETRLHWFSPALLRTRLGLALAIAASAPLVLAVSLASIQDERSVKNEILLSQQNQASTVASAVSSYLRLHQSALEALAAEPDLMQLAPAAQRQQLQVYQAAFTDTLAFELYDPQGLLLARSPAGRGAPVDIVRRLVQSDHSNRQAVMEMALPSPGMAQVLIFGQPVLDRLGQVAGLVTFWLPVDRMGQFLAAQTGAAQNDLYLAGDQGLLIVQSNPDEGQEALNLKDAAIQEQLARHAAGALAYRPPAGGAEQLIGFAKVAGSSWTVCVEYPADQALAGIHAGRDLAYGVLLVFLLIMLIVAVVLSAQLTAPLGKLAVAVQELAAGNTRTPLPNSPVRELQRLTAAFAEMRARLASRSLENWQADLAARQANANLETQVVERTASLRRANTLLEQLNQQLAAANLSLQRQLVSSHPDAPAGMPAGEMVDLNILLTEVLAELDAEIAAVQGYVEASRLPSLQADRDQMHVLFRALIENTLQRRKPEAAPVLRIGSETSSINETECGKIIRIILEDNGYGFDEPDLEQTNPAEKPGQFRGELARAGLDLCRAIVTSYRGSLEATSRRNQGATITVTLPVLPPESPH